MATTQREMLIAKRDVTGAARAARYRAKRDARREAELNALRAAAFAANQQRDRTPAPFSQNGQMSEMGKTQASSPSIVGLPRASIEAIAQRTLASGQASASVSFTLAQAVVGLLKRLPDLETIEL